MDTVPTWFFSAWAALAVIFNFLPEPLHASEQNAQVIADAVYLKPQRLVEVEPGRRLNVYCSGRGSPTVTYTSTNLTRSLLRFWRSRAQLSAK